MTSRTPAPRPGPQVDAATPRRPRRGRPRRGRAARLLPAGAALALTTLAVVLVTSGGSGSGAAVVDLASAWHTWEPRSPGSTTATASTTAASTPTACPTTRREWWRAHRVAARQHTTAAACPLPTRSSTGAASASAGASSASAPSVTTSSSTATSSPTATSRSSAPSPVATSSTSSTRSPSRTTASSAGAPTSSSASGGSATTTPASTAPSTGTSSSASGTTTSATGATASGTAVPRGDLPGWKQTFVDDFTTPTTSFPGSAYEDTWATYQGLKDTSKAGTYDEARVVSVHDGLMDMHLRTIGGQALAAAPIPTPGGQWGQRYGRYSVRYRSDAIKGYSSSWLLWPNSDNWSEGEIDFPNGPLDGQMYAANMCVGQAGTWCFKKEGLGTFTSWHTATIEWTPSGVTFYLDGTNLGTSTASPSTAMHWVLQTETAYGKPPADSDGHVYVDWVAIWSRA